ncbi:MAG: hypothetical protein K2K34_09665, partial [Oscillospiraceae bacterium]|nr:hypothetical protein [Oscillospiraceae bacterium]
MIYATNCRDASAAKPPWKSFARLFKGGRFPKGRALWSPSADGEIPSPRPQAHIVQNGERGEKCDSISRGSGH